MVRPRELESRQSCTVWVSSAGTLGYMGAVWRRGVGSSRRVKSLGGGEEEK